MRVLSLSADGECFRFAARRAKDSHPPLHLPARDALLFGPRVYKPATLHTPVFFHAGFCGIYWEYINRTRGIRCSPKPQNQDITLKEPLKESLEKLLWNSYSTLRGHPIIELYSTPTEPLWKPSKHSEARSWSMFSSFFTMANLHKEGVSSGGSKTYL